MITMKQAETMGREEVEKELAVVTLKMAELRSQLAELDSQRLIFVHRLNIIKALAHRGS